MQTFEWEFWLDNNISPIIAKWLTDDTGWNFKSAYALNTRLLSDYDFFLKARKSGNVILITKDSDFSRLVIEFGPPPKILYVAEGNCDNKLLYSILKNNLEKAVNMLIVFDKHLVEINNV